MSVHYGYIDQNGKLISKVFAGFGGGYEWAWLSLEDDSPLGYMSNEAIRSYLTYRADLVYQDYVAQCQEGNFDALSFEAFIAQSDYQELYDAFVAARDAAAPQPEPIDESAEQWIVYITERDSGESLPTVYRDRAAAYAAWSATCVAIDEHGHGEHYRVTLDRLSRRSLLTGVYTCRETIIRAHIITARAIRRIKDIIHHDGPTSADWSVYMFSYAAGIEIESAGDTEGYDQIVANMRQWVLAQ